MKLRSGMSRLLLPGKRWRTIIGMLLLTALLGYALYALFRPSATGPHIWELLSHISVTLLFQASLIYALDLALVIVGWGWIMGRFTGLWDWRQHTRIYTITAITRRLPGTLWYVIGRIALYEQFGVRRVVTGVANGVEFATLVLGGLIVIALTWPLSLIGLQINLVWIALGILFGSMLLSPPVIRWMLRRMSPSTYALQLRYRDLLGWMLLYAAAWIVGGTILFVLASAFHPLTLAQFPAFVCLWTLSGVVTSFFSFVPFGFGVQELTLTALLTPVIGATESLTVALIMRGLLTINEIVWAGVGGVIGLIFPVAATNTNGLSGALISPSDEVKPKEVLEQPR